MTPMQAERFMRVFWRFMFNSEYNDIATMHTIDWDHNQELVPMSNRSIERITEKFQRYVAEKEPEDPDWANN